MDVKIEETGPCQRTVSVKVPADKVKQHVEAVFREAAKQVDIKGFRRGKVPRKVLEQRFGDDILMDAKRSLIDQSFQEAVSDSDMDIVGNPRLEGIEEGPLNETEEVSFDVVVDIRPTIEITKAKGLKVKKGEEEVKDEDVDGAFQQLADQRKKLQEVDDAAEEADFVKTKLTFKNEDGEVVAERADQQLNGRIPIAGTDADAFAAALTGVSKGETITQELTFPANFEKEEVRGQKGTVEISVDSVLRITAPPIDEEFAKSLDFETVEEMREDLTKRIGEEKKRLNLQRQEDDLINALIAEHPFALPESVVEEQKQHLIKAYVERLEEQKLSEEDIETKVKEADGEATEDAEKRVRVFFLLDAVAKKEKIFVTEGDVDVEIRNIATQNQASPEQVREYFEQHKMLGDLRVQVQERKVREFLRENAEFTD